MRSEDLKGLLRGLVNPEGRPADLTPTDMILLLLLVEKGALSSPVRCSATTLGMALNVSEPTIKASTDRLRACGWIEVKSGKGRQAPNLYTVLLEHLPVGEDLKRTVITTAMLVLAGQYANVIKNANGKKRRFTKGNIQRMAHVFQQFLDRSCAGDETLLRGALRLALSSPKYQAKAYRGPHQLRRDFTKILAEYKGLPETATPEIAAQPQKVDHAQRMQTASKIAEQLQASIYKHISDARILDNWRDTWPLEILKLLEAGHDADQISTLAVYAAQHVWFGATELGPKGATGFVASFEAIKASYDKENNRAAA